MLMHHDLIADRFVPPLHRGIDRERAYVHASSATLASIRIESIDEEVNFKFYHACLRLYVAVERGHMLAGLHYVDSPFLHRHRSIDATSS